MIRTAIKFVQIGDSSCRIGVCTTNQGFGLFIVQSWSNSQFPVCWLDTVVASLWKVDDKATAVLMADFYESMLQKGMSPAAALRSAKLKMKQDRQWSAPYYWAGFVLQGEYANRIAVDHHSSLRLALVLLFLLSLIVAGFCVFQKRKRRFSPPQ